MVSPPPGGLPGGACRADLSRHGLGLVLLACFAPPEAHWGFALWSWGGLAMGRGLRTSAYLGSGRAIWCGLRCRSVGSSGVWGGSAAHTTVRASGSWVRPFRLRANWPAYLPAWGHASRVVRVTCWPHGAGPEGPPNGRRAGSDVASVRVGLSPNPFATIGRQRVELMRVRRLVVQARSGHFGRTGLNRSLPSQTSYGLWHY